MKYICIEEYYTFKKNEVYELVGSDFDIYFDYIASLADFDRLMISKFDRTLTNRQNNRLKEFLTHFIPLAQFREDRINKILND